MEVHQESSLSSKVFQKLRNDILERRYQEHDELKEVTLAKELNVSRTPVREALRQLELEGLITMVPNKGAVVTGILAKDIQDIYSIRSLLEGLCIRWATENITNQQIEELDEIIMLSEFYLKKDDYSEQLLALDEKFHRILYEASNSRILSNLLVDYHHYVCHLRRHSFATEERARKSIREHKQIFRAIREGDSDMAEQYANEHILQVIQNMRKNGFEENSIYDED